MNVETYKRTPQQLFNMPQHFVIPLFQRPYVWEEDEQWAPLWKDIRRTVEFRISEPQSNASHFLGAVVIQAHEASAGSISTWNVIDGQQRMTTLQLLMDAAQAVATDYGLERQADRLSMLTHNLPSFVAARESKLKLRHLNKDRDAFDEVMDAQIPVEYAELKSVKHRIVQAHQYFDRAIREWVEEQQDKSDLLIETLAHVLESGLQLVTIELTAAEDSQEIFETLNARGTPLTVSDLVRNYVFQRIEAEGGSSAHSYEHDWPFEATFWTTEVSVGRQRLSRSSLFLNQWLVSKLGEEISPATTFSRFKIYFERRAAQRMSDLLVKIKRQADSYETWTRAASRPDGNLDPFEMAVYRMQASGIELLKPLLIWLNDPEMSWSNESAYAVIRAAESWVYRRQILRTTGSDLGRVVAELIRLNGQTRDAELPERVIAYLSRLNVSSTYWPGDREVRSALLREPVYRRYPRARLRMFLETIENQFREETRQPQVQRRELPIEHVLPQKWEESWPVDSFEEEEERRLHVHRLGNLTLLTTSLNSKVSNGPWLEKRRSLLSHNTISLTGRILERTEDSAWDEEHIDIRSAELADALLRYWAVPDGHDGDVVDPQSKIPDWVQLKHLLELGAVASGEKVLATHRDFMGVEGRITSDGRIEVNGAKYSTPSAAAKALRQKPTNGWYFWALADGRRLRDVRAEAASGGGFLHAHSEAPVS